MTFCCNNILTLQHYARSINESKIHNIITQTSECCFCRSNECLLYMLVRKYYSWFPHILTGQHLPFVPLYLEKMAICIPYRFSVNVTRIGSSLHTAQNTIFLSPLSNFLLRFYTILIIIWNDDCDHLVGVYAVIL